MTAMPDGSGYWFTAADGGLFNYGDAPFYGSSAGQGLGQVVAMTTDGLPTAPGHRGRCRRCAPDIPALRGDHLPAWHAGLVARHGLNEPRADAAGIGPAGPARQRRTMASPSTSTVTVDPSR